MRLIRLTLICAVGFMMIPALAASSATGAAAAKRSQHDRVHWGRASWYSIKCNGGTHTASGETLDNWARTAAHKTLPMGTRVRVTNLRNGRSLVVRINDRGPYIKGRIIDVTKGVAHKLGFIKAGVVPVKVEVL